MNELAERMHSVISVWLVALVIFRLGKDLGGRTAGWWGAVGWITSLQALIHGRLCVADMPMVPCVSLAMLALSLAHHFYEGRVHDFSRMKQKTLR